MLAMGLVCVATLIPAPTYFESVCISSLAHPCDLHSNGGCAQICNNYVIDYNCSCNEGYKLAEDLKNCIQGKLL